MSRPTVVRRKTCRFCDSRALDLVLPLTPAPLVDQYVPKEKLGVEQPPYPLDLHLCRDCGLAQILDVVDPEILYRVYLYETKSSLGLVEHFGRYAEDVLARAQPAKGALVVDVGSNDGSLLRFFKERGMKVLGVDPAREIAEAATKSGIETLPDFFTEEYGKRLRRERGPAAVITINNLFANVDDLVDLTKGVRELLADDGVFVFESSHAEDMINQMVFDFIYHEHLSYFSAKPVEAFFRRMGLELIDVQRTSPKGGSMRYTAQRAGGPRKASPAVAAQLAHEKTIGLHGPEIYAAWRARIDKTKAELLDLLKGLKAQGKTIAAYGASATTTTLTHHFDLLPLISFFVDDYSWKQGLYSPGKHIPVLPADALYEKKPDVVLMAAWRYAEPIMKKHRKYLEQGGRFVIPLPSVQVRGAQAVGSPK